MEPRARSVRRWKPRLSTGSFTARARMPNAGDWPPSRLGWRSRVGSPSAPGGAELSPKDPEKYFCELLPDSARGTFPEPGRTPFHSFPRTPARACAHSGMVCPSRAYNSCAIRARRTLPPTCSPACRAPAGRATVPAGPCVCICPSSIMPNLASRSPGPPWWIRRTRRSPPQCAAPECSELLFVRAADRRSTAARPALVPLAEN